MDMHVEVVVPARGDNIFKSEKLLVSKKVSLIARNSQAKWLICIYM